MTSLRSLHLQLLRSAGFLLELRNPVQVLSAKELKKALCATRLPKHMKSIPKIKAPKNSMLKKGAKQKQATGKANDDDDESDGAFDTLLCFADPQQPYRIGSLVQAFGAGSSSDQMPKQLWDGQAAAVLQQVVAQQTADMRTEVVMEGRQLPTLDEFLEQKTPSRRRTGSRPKLGRSGAGHGSSARDELPFEESSGETADPADGGWEGASQEEAESADPETKDLDELRAAAQAGQKSQQRFCAGASDANKSPAKSPESSTPAQSYCNRSARSVVDSCMSDEEAELEGDPDHIICKTPYIQLIDKVSHFI